MTVREDRLFAELDRQLTEVRASCADMAAKSGIMLSATGVAVALLAARLNSLTPGVVATMIVLGIATIFGLVALAPRLLPGPASAEMTTWLMQQDSSAAIGSLFAAKRITLDANKERQTTMLVGLRLQGAAVLVATVLALIVVVIGA